MCLQSIVNSGLKAKVLENYWLAHVSTNFFPF